MLWTRLAPEPLDGGGMPAEPVEVRWEVAEDAGLGRVVRQGVATAWPALAHSVHVEVSGLKPDRPYWYRFRAGGEASPVGRARTAPAPGAAVGALRFAFASCQHWEQGYYAAYRHMIAPGDLDLIVHLGDYIYEVSSWSDEVRRHEGPKPTTLEGFRNRHALYKTDPDLQAAHAACPWLLTWDDHEVENDYAGDHSQERTDPRVFRERRAAAYQAYWEHMPLRRLARPRGAEMRLWSRVPYGDLVDLWLLDERQHRSVHACDQGPRGGGRVLEGCAERLDPARTMLGVEQERWLLGGLARTRARWNVLAQGVVMTELRQKTRSGGLGHWSDGWDGYPAARTRLLRQLQERRVPNPVVLSGDIHSFWVSDLKPDFAAQDAPAVATEFVCTSITSAGVPYDTFAGFLPDNPHVKFFESRRRGYVRCTVGRDQWQSELCVVDDHRDPASAGRTLATFVIEAGRPGARKA